MNKVKDRHPFVKKSSKISMAKIKICQKQELNKSKTAFKKGNSKQLTKSKQQQKYIIENMIGQGMYSKVYKARIKDDEKKYVIKLIKKQTLRTQQRKNAFKRQIEALNLPKHPNLVSLIDQFQNQHYIGIVMEYFSNTSLSQIVKNKCQRFNNQILQKITKQICQGLIYLHSNGFSHRDIKPQNILVNSEYEIKIIDFGFATTSQLDEVVVAGTPKYMAPELIIRKNYDPLKADVWAFGIMLYWIALGYFPQDVDKKQLKVINNKVSQMNLYFPIDINPGLEYLLRKMLHPDPKQRIQLKNIMEDTWLKPKMFKNEIDKLRQFTNTCTSLKTSSI